MAHLLTLSVGTDTPEQHKAVHSLLSDIGGEFAQDYHYASVTSVDVDRPADGDEEFHDEHTMFKVREAIKSAIEVRVATAPEAMITGIISELQNAGILFRERRAV
jgi:hypothetical protein